MARKNKIIPISEYESMKTEDLIDEVKARREGVRNPQLDGLDWFVNIGGSLAFIASGASYSASVLHSWWKKIDPKHFADVSRDIFSSQNAGLEAKLKHLNQNKDVRNNIAYSALAFAVTAVASIFVIKQTQTSERAEDNATKHMFGIDELHGRGYRQIPTGEFLKYSESKKYWQERIEEEKSNIEIETVNPEKTHSRY